MSDTDGLAALRGDIEQLAALLLPETPSAEQTEEDPLAAEPNAEESLRIRAYLILAHSGIEEAIEEAISGSVTTSIEERDVAPPAVALSLATKYADELIGQNGGKVPGAGWIAQRLPGLYKSKVITPNNGIRRKSIEAMCKPLGIDVAELGAGASQALSALDTLGAKRGAAAHTLRGAAQETVHADEAGQWVQDALDGLAILIPLIEGAIKTREIASTPDAEEGVDDQAEA